ncbi:hypothetical protein EWI07_05795 [Sporolactobacillus sp. THM7-4]|nr:hypothetical protein EWI07_05795 [Sporolactobacillus sp. THM7-4]
MSDTLYRADSVIIGSPVYKVSLAGILKSVA